MMPRFPFDNSYARLPPRFFVSVQPTPVAAPGWIRFNRTLAVELGLDPDSHAEDAAFFAGNRLPEGAEPLSMAYAGHQFGHFVPQLGDGRAILLGEVIDRNGVRRDIQLKGSGPTPFSRRGDGRAALGPVLREYIVSEAMTALGVPSTRALAAVTTGQTVLRETALPGAVLTRVAASHLRIGTFQFFAARGDVEAVRRLADFAIERHYPAARTTAHPYRALLEGVIGRQAALVAQWLSIGFIHGVMNTDNTSISGETIDFGPCAFIDEYDPATVFSSIDQGGRYAYGNQPPIMQWNLARLAETLLPLLADDPSDGLAVAEEAIDGFGARFAAEFIHRFRSKLGLFTAEAEDIGLIQGLLDIMARQRADFTLTFRRLCAVAVDPATDADVRRLFDDPTAYDGWVLDWRRRLDMEPQAGVERQTLMRGVNPAVIPRNHRVEAVITAAVEHGDLAPFDDLLAAVCEPFGDRFPAYQSPPTPDERVTQTFCGT